jgi:hypothetical protein
MFQGMPALWKDPKESPKRLLELRTTLEYHLDLKDSLENKEKTDAVQQPMKLLWNEELREAVQPGPQCKNPNDFWWCTDLATLKAMVMQERTEQIGLARYRHLEVWERTCGGREFMFQGMPALWKDPTESPKRLLELRTTLEYHLDAEREKAYADLVMKELKEGVIVPIPWDQVKFASPFL